jgi:hypothetical protein
MHEPSIQLKDPIPNVQLSKSLLIKLGQKHAQSLQKRRDQVVSNRNFLLKANNTVWGITSSSFLLLFVE